MEDSTARRKKVSTSPTIARHGDAHFPLLTRRMLAFSCFALSHNFRHLNNPSGLVTTHQAQTRIRVNRRPRAGAFLQPAFICRCAFLQNDGRHDHLSAVVPPPPPVQELSLTFFRGLNRKVSTAWSRLSPSLPVVHDKRSDIWQISRLRSSNEILRSLQEGIGRL